MAEKKTYTGGCHCGEVRFEVTADLSSVVSCNCSICQKRGALWVFVAPGKLCAARRARGSQGLSVRQEELSSPVLPAMRRGRILARHCAERRRDGRHQCALLG